MKTTRTLVLLTCILAATTRSSAEQTDAAAAADATVSRWYARSSLGFDFTRSSGVTLDFTQAPEKISFYTGTRFDASVGYQLRHDTALEVETGWIATGNLSIANRHMSFKQLSVLFNVRQRWDRGGPFVPYVGIGAGNVACWLDVRDTVIQGSHLRGKDWAGALAGQIFAGFDYHLTGNWSLGLAYKGLWTSSPEWNLPSFDPTKAFGVIKLKSPIHHAVSLEISWRH